MIKPITLERIDTCPSCKAKRSLELYNSKNKPLKFSDLLDKNVNLKETVHDLSYIKCQKCNKRFFPRWQDDKIFVTERMNLEDFMALFAANKKKAEST